MVKGGDNIKLSINFNLTKPLKSLIYKRYGVLVLNYNSIKSSIINIELIPLPSFLVKRIEVTTRNMLG